MAQQVPCMCGACQSWIMVDTLGMVAWEEAKGRRYIVAEECIFPYEEDCRLVTWDDDGAYRVLEISDSHPWVAFRRAVA